MYDKTTTTWEKMKHARDRELQTRLYEARMYAF